MVSYSQHTHTQTSPYLNHFVVNTDSVLVTNMLVNCFIGKGPSDSSYKSWSLDPKHRAQAKTLGIFESIWPGNGGALPWRLTKDARDLLESRMGNCVWPHYMERLYYKGKYLYSITSPYYIYKPYMETLNYQR